MPVQAAYGVKSLGASVIDQGHDRSAVLRVIGGGNEVLGLVQEHVSLLFHGKALPAIVYPVSGTHFCAKFGNHLAVHLYNPCGNKIIRIATACNPTLAKKPVQANATIPCPFLGLLAPPACAIRSTTYVAFVLRIAFTVAPFGPIIPLWTR